LGPGASARQILHQSRQLQTKIKGGRPVTVGARSLTEHEISEAANKLREPAVRIEETLCVHRPLQSSQSRLQKLLSELEQLTHMSEQPSPVRFVNPLALLWFCPAPGPDHVPLPSWEAFGLVAPHDPDDLALDLVFDC
jgi:hypothetical protein